MRIRKSNALFVSVSFRVHDDLREIGNICLIFNVNLNQTPTVNKRVCAYPPLVRLKVVQNVLLREK